MTQATPLSEGAQRILRIAAPLFAVKGFSGVSINDIAEAVGGSKANIFHHFPNKQALYLAAIGIYHFEHEVQPERYASVFDSLWWAVATLTTVGYGDITPVSLIARSLAMLEGLIGQLYPAILLARLVALEDALAHVGVEALVAAGYSAGIDGDVKPAGGLEHLTRSGLSAHHLSHVEMFVCLIVWLRLRYRALFVRSFSARSSGNESKHDTKGNT